jgi:hypothetical protein
MVKQVKQDEQVNPARHAASSAAPANQKKVTLSQTSSQHTALKGVPLQQLRGWQLSM